MNPEPPVIPTPASRRWSLFLKIAGIGFLLLLLQIPLLMTEGVLRERQGYQAKATEQIAGLWGRSQTITGPVLMVPYSYQSVVTRTRESNGHVVQVDEKIWNHARAFFLPEQLAIEGTVDPETRHRGIYDVVVYNTRVGLTGEFRPDFAAANISAEQIDWGKAMVLFGVSDLHGVRAISPWPGPDGAATAFDAADGSDCAGLPLAAKLSGLTAGKPLTVSFQVTLQGSSQLAFTPVGKATTATLQSKWADPSFNGAFLPVLRSVTPDGFTAKWEISHLSRGFPSSWTNRQVGNSTDMLTKNNGAGFGATFARPVDGYRMAERAQKYGMLFFVQVFAVFFLFEVTARLRIHPLQYAMVGMALCLFFLGFLALSEFWPAGWAYAVAAGACTAVVALYAWSFLRTGGRTAVIGGGLAVTYGYLYFVLQSQDYALLAGTLALFATLALVMYCTRRIDWYALDLPGTGNAGMDKP